MYYEEKNFRYFVWLNVPVWICNLDLSDSF